MSEILYEKSNRIGIITLNRPEKRNAFTSEMLNQWKEALLEAQDDRQIRAIVITGKGPAFCAGGDLEQLLESTTETNINMKNELWNNVHMIPKILQRIDKPIITAMNGDAVGAGLDMALWTDIRFASSDAKFSVGYINVGLIPGDGGAYPLQQFVGKGKALEILLSGKFFNAIHAKEMGIVNEVYHPQELLPKTLEFAEILASKAPISLQLTKRIFYQSTNIPVETHLDMVSSHLAVIRKTEDHREAILAFKEKRKPDYKGY